MSKSMKWLLVGLAVYAGLLFCIRKSYAAEWPTNYQHFNDIRDFARFTPKHTPIRIVLNDDTKIYGELLSYERYQDYIWFQPQGTHSWFFQDAVDVHEISTIEIFPLTK